LINKCKYKKCMSCPCHKLYRLADGTYEHYCHPPLCSSYVTVSCEVAAKLRHRRYCKEIRRVYEELHTKCGRVELDG
jgi:hypothetical protein